MPPHNSIIISLLQLLSKIVLLIFLLLYTQCSSPQEEASTEVADGFAYIDHFPDWGTNEKIVFHYAFVSGRSLAPENPTPIQSDGVYVIDSDGNNLQKVVLDLTMGSSLTNPQWNPDGTWITFSSGAQIWKTRSDGSDLQQITTQGRNFFPTWNFAGDLIAYDRTLPSNQAGIWIKNPNEQDEKYIALGRYPSWAKDDSSIVYLGLGENIFQYFFKDSSSVQLSAFSESFLSGTSIRYPEISPNGESIVFHIERSLAFSVWSLNIADRNIHKLIDDAAFPTWSPDGKKILYTNPKVSNGYLWIYDVNSQDKNQLTF